MIYYTFTDYANSSDIINHVMNEFYPLQGPAVVKDGVGVEWFSDEL